MISPIYIIGDTVWHCRVTWLPITHECPDCFGTGKWEVTTPAKETFEMNCMRCTGHNGDYALTTYKFQAHVNKLTVGSIRYDSGAKPEEQYSYMCVETGIGSGSIYYEDFLYSTEKEAQCAAEVQSRAANEARKDDPSFEPAHTITRNAILTIRQLKLKE